MKHKNTQPLYIFNRENPKNSEPQNGTRSGLDVLMNWCNMISKSTIKTVSFPNEHFSQKTKAKKNFYWNYLTLGRKIIQSFFIVKIWNRFSQWNWGNIPKLKYFAADQNSLPVRNHVKLMHVINSRRGFSKCGGY